jgi:hypothetical protein
MTERAKVELHAESADTPEGKRYRVRVVANGETYYSQIFTTAEERDALVMQLAAGLAERMENPRFVFSDGSEVCGICRADLNRIQLDSSS